MQDILNWENREFNSKLAYSAFTRLFLKITCLQPIN